jgi:hypothetical protein
MSYTDGSGCIVGHELLLQLDFSQLIRHSHKLINTYSGVVFQWFIVYFFAHSLSQKKLLAMSDNTLAKMFLFTTRNDHGWS